VCPLVTLEFVGACEPLAAEGPAADEGPLARVPAEVGSEVRRLAVDLVAARDVADVLLLLRGVVAVWSGGAERERALLDTHSKTTGLFSSRTLMTALTKNQGGSVRN